MHVTRTQMKRDLVVRDVELVAESLRVSSSESQVPDVQSGKRDSNPRPQPWQGCALPTELFPRGAKYISAMGAGGWGMGDGRWANSYGRSPSALILYQTDHARRPESAASPPFATALPSASTVSAAVPPSRGARRSHCNTSLASGPTNRAHCCTSDCGATSIAFTVRRYVESWRGTASYIGSQ